MALQNLAPIADPTIAKAATDVANAYIGREMAIAQRQADQRKALEDLRRWQAEMGIKQKQLGISEDRLGIEQEQSLYDIGRRPFTEKKEQTELDNILQNMAFAAELQPGKVKEQKLNISTLQQALDTAKTMDPLKITEQEQKVTTGKQELADKEKWFEATGFYGKMPTSEKITFLASQIPTLKRNAAETRDPAAINQWMDAEQELEILRGRMSLEEVKAERAKDLPTDRLLPLTEGQTVEVVDPDTGKRRIMSIAEAVDRGLAEAPARKPGFDIESLQSEYNAMREARTSAATQNRQLAELERVVNDPTFTSGKLEDATMWLKGWASSFGIPIGEGYSGQQVARAIANNLALSRSGALTGPASDKDMALIQSAGPDLANSPEAMRALVRLMQRENNYAIAKADMADLWLSSNENTRGFDGAFKRAIPSIQEKIPEGTDPYRVVLDIMAYGSEEDRAELLNELISQRK